MTDPTDAACIRWHDESLPDLRRIGRLHKRNAGQFRLVPLTRKPWIGVGLTLLVVGLAATALFALLPDVVEPLGWWRLLALPPALFVASFWAFDLVVGVPTSGGPDFDVGTILYAAPQMLVVLLIATVLIALPLIVVRPVRGSEPP